MNEIYTLKLYTYMNEKCDYIYSVSYYLNCTNS